MLYLVSVILDVQELADQLSNSHISPFSGQYTVVLDQSIRHRLIYPYLGHAY
jgi:hypothetical protein